LTKDLVAITKTDLVNPRGERTVEDGNLSDLLGFEFNLNGKLGSTLFAPFSVAFDRATGSADVTLAAFSPTVRIAAPSGTTHFNIVMGAAEEDFVNDTFVFETASSGILPYTAPDTAPIAMNVPLTANSVLPVIEVVGIEFYQEVNGQMYPLKNGAFNALSVALIDTL